MTVSVYEVPLVPGPQVLSTTINGVRYALRLIYMNEPEGGWLLDISTAAGVPLLCGVPLVTGCDLLEQYAYLGIGAQLVVYTDGDPDAPPTYSNLGTGSHLILVVKS